MESKEIFLIKLAELVEKKIGIPFSNEKISLYLSSIFKLSPTLAAMNYPDYLNRLETANVLDDGEWKLVLQSLNISESYFFRDQPQLDFLQTFLLPNLVSQYPKRSTLSVWSAGCSTGEEVYTLVFILKTIFREPDFRIRVLGSDINQNSIYVAQKARYSSWSLRGVSDSQKSAYFSPVSGEFDVKIEYQSLVEFRRENLLNVNYSEEFDLILCRNVFIYLNEETKRILLEKFANALKPGGVLVLGHSEVRTEIPKVLKASYNSGFLYFTKDLEETAIVPKITIKDSGVVTKECIKERKYSDKSIENVIREANSGNLSKAKEACLSILSDEAHNFEALYWLAQIFEAEGDYLSAESKYLNIIQKNQEFLEAYISLSSLYTILGRDKESEYHKLKCLDLISKRYDLQTLYTKKGYDMFKLFKYLESQNEIWVA